MYYLTCTLFDLFSYTLQEESIDFKKPVQKRRIVFLASFSDDDSTVHSKQKLSEMENVNFRAEENILCSLDLAK